MKLKQLPITITLAAAFISCVASIYQGVAFSLFTKRLVIVVLCFYIFGVILQVVIERTFKAMEPEEEPIEEESEEEVEE